MDTRTMVGEQPNEQVIKVVQALGFLLSKDSNHKMERIKLMKLLWAADRFHLRRYGRTVSGASYMAQVHGPVASIALDIARLNKDGPLNEKDIKYIEEFFTPDVNGTAMSKEPGMDYLSETDKEALQFSWDAFGEFDTMELSDEISHKYPEWSSFAEYFGSGQCEPQKIDNEKFFENPKDDEYFQLDPNMLEAAKATYLENEKIKNLLEA